MDAAGLRAVLEAMADGRIQTTARELPEPSVFAHEILNANPYAFLDDAPLEERRTRAVSLRRGLPAAIVERIGGLDPEAVESVLAESQVEARDPDELHDLLLDAGALPEAMGAPAVSAICSRRWWLRAGPPGWRACRCCGWRPNGARWPRWSGRPVASSRTSSSRPPGARRPGPTRRARWSRSSAVT